MRIGLTGGAATVERMVEQAERAEADGFTSLWYASAVGRRPARRPWPSPAQATTHDRARHRPCCRPTPCHPVLQANRAAVDGGGDGPARASRSASARRTSPVIEDVYGLSYDHPGRHTEEYVRVLDRAAAGRGASTSTARTSGSHPGRPRPLPQPVPGAAWPRLAPRPAAGGRRARPTARSSGWATPGPSRPTSRPTHQRRGRRPRAGPRRGSSPGCRSRCTTTSPRPGPPPASEFASYGVLPNYRRILDHRRRRRTRATPRSSATRPSVTAQIEALFAAGATDVWAAAFPVGDDRQASRRRTRALLQELANARATSVRQSQAAELRRAASAKGSAKGSSLAEPLPEGSTRLVDAEGGVAGASRARRPARVRRCAGCAPRPARARGRPAARGAAGCSG